MAWVHGNDPTGFQIREGRILCEAMFAINEREYAMKETETVWSYVGNRPATNALAGQQVIEIRPKTLLLEMQTAVDYLVSGVGGAYDPEWETGAGVVYTKASLLTAAFGAVDWTNPVGKNINNVTMISEILKAVELLTRLEKNIIKKVPLSLQARQKAWDGAAVATTVQANINCEAQATGPVPGPGQGFIGTNVVGAAGPLYTHYGKGNFGRHFHVENIPPTPTLISGKIRYLGVLAGAFQNHSQTIKVYELTAAQWAAYAWAGAGDLIHTITTPLDVNYHIEALDDHTPIDISVADLYIQVVPEIATTPFPNNQLDMYSGIWFDDDWQFRITFTFVPTYN